MFINHFIILSPPNTFTSYFIRPLMLINIHKLYLYNEIVEYMDSSEF
jgi:hypothetical protein